MTKTSRAYVMLAEAYAHKTHDKALGRRSRTDASGSRVKLTTDIGYIVAVPGCRDGAVKAAEHTPRTTGPARTAPGRRCQGVR